MKRTLPFGIIVFVFATAVTLAFYLRHSIDGGGAVAAPHGAASKPPVTAPLPGAVPAHVRGSMSARITLEEFADFQCPACGNFYPLLKSIEQEYGAQVSVIFREFPLTLQHQHANSAAQAAEAAGLQGKFWEMHDMLYENRGTWSKSVDVQPFFEEYARRIGLNLDQFKRDQISEIVKNRITLDHQRARSIRVKSTPSLYLNGVEVPYSEMKTIERLRMVVNKSLNSN